MAKYTVENTKASYISAWNNMIIKPEILPAAQKVAKEILSYKDKYAPLEQATGVPWYFIGLLHMRESNFDFNTHLHNGDKLNVNGKFKRTTHVPAGRPIAPPKNGQTYTFEESALDALVYEFGKIKTWDIAQMAYFLELYNGFGYRQRGLPSPYLWAGSNQYIKGKYIADGVFDPTVVDSQLGTMVVLKCVLALDAPVLVSIPDADPVQAEAVEKKEVTPISPSADIVKPKSSAMRKVSRKFNLVDWAQQFFGWLTGGTIIVKTLDANSITATKSLIDTMKVFVNDYGVYAFVGILIVGFIGAQLLKNWMKEDVAANRYDPSGVEKQ